MNPMSQDRTRASLSSPHTGSHPTASVYPYGSTVGSSMGVGSGPALNDSLAQSRPQYQPGYLLSLAQSQAMPMTGQRVEEPLLIPTRAKINSANTRNAPSDFGSDSMFENTSKHRLRDAAIDEDGPPTSSVTDLVSEVYADPRRQLFNSPGLISARKDNSGPSPPPVTPHQTLYVVVFGYPQSRFSSTLAHFQRIADGGTTEPELSLDVENAFKIGYKHPWEAARAWRRNGDVISGEGGRWMVGVKWMDPLAAEQVLGSGARASANTTLFTRPEAPYSSQENGDADQDPSLSQLQQVSIPQQDSSPSVGAPMKLAPSASAFRKPTPDLSRKEPLGHVWATSTSSPSNSRGMLGQVSDLIFGW